MPSPTKAAKAKDRDEVTTSHRKTPRERELEREKAAKAKAAEAKAASKATKNGKPAAKAEPVKEAKSEKADKKESSSSSRIAVKAVSKAVEAKPAPKPVKVTNYKSPFSASELAEWRKLLTSRRNEISSDIAGLEKDAMEAEDGHTTPNHIAERGSDADLQDVSLGIAGEEKDLIWQIDRALAKIVSGQPIPFGLCEYSKEPISKNRLQLIPWTALSIEGATYLEENGLTVEDIMEE